MLFGPGGIYVDSADYGDVGQGETLFYTPTTGGTYYMDVQGYASSTGSYALTMTAFAPVVGDVPGNSSSTVKLQVPGFTSNQIDKVAPNQASDADWFSIRLHQGSSYLFYLTSTDGTLDGQLQVFDAQGNPVYDQLGNGFADKRLVCRRPGNHGVRGAHHRQLFHPGHGLPGQHRQIQPVLGRVGGRDTGGLEQQRQLQQHQVEPAGLGRVEPGHLDQLRLERDQRQPGGLAVAAVRARLQLGPTPPRSTTPGT